MSNLPEHYPTCSLSFHRPPIEQCPVLPIERKHAAYFAMQREMAREEYKGKREEERAWKCEKAQHVKEVYDRVGEKALMKGKWARLTQDWWTILF
jgi:hypothetical protein